MPFAYRMDLDLNVFYLITYGHCTFSDIFSPSLTPELNPANRPRLKFIVDNFFGDLETDEEGIRFFVKSMDDLKKTGFQLEPTAVLTSKKGLFIFIQTLELLVNNGDSPTHQAFSSFHEALAWLGETENTQAIQRIRDELLEGLRSQKG